MGSVLLYTFFATSFALAVLGAFHFIRVSYGLPVLGDMGLPTSRWLHAFMLGIGLLGVLSSAPSIFSENPHWFVDGMYFLVSTIIEATE